MPRIIAYWLLPLLLALPAVAEPIGVALIGDGPQPQEDVASKNLRQEIDALLADEFEVEYLVWEGDWTADGINRALEEAYADPRVDAVVVTGVLANQILGKRERFTKPTLLPIVFDASLLGLPRQGVGSGKANLAYLTGTTDFSVDLESFRRVTDFDTLGVLVDAVVLGAVADVAEQATRIAKGAGVEIVLLPFSDPEGDLVGMIPPQVDAVMIGGADRLSDAALERLVEGLIERGLPSFSFDGDDMVERGMLVADTRRSNWQRIGRKTALQLQGALLGEDVSRLPVDFLEKRRLFLNMATARALGIWPTYSVLIEAELVNAEPPTDGAPWTLAEVAREAVRNNLAYLAQSYDTSAQEENITQARANWRPQVSSSLQGNQLRSGSSAVESGAVAERSLTAALSLQQLLWSESARAGVEIQQLAFDGARDDLEAFRLDTIQQATLAFLNVQLAETQWQVQRNNLEVTRANLDLARDRVRIGASNPSDVYRWESELAGARQTAIDAVTDRDRAYESLNGVLNRPLTERRPITPSTLDDPELLDPENEIGELIDNPGSFQAFAEQLVQDGLERAPEIRALESSLAVLERQLTSERRSYYSPEVSLQGQASDVVSESRSGPPGLEGEEDWSVAVSATLPLYTGGARKSRQLQRRLEIEAVEHRLASLREQIELGIRSNLHLANASYNNIPLAEQAAEASRRNLELVTASYREGATGILDLLDAQNASLRAELGAASTVYEFLIDLMNVQRAVGQFDFFLDPEERRQTLEDIKRSLTQGEESP
ncbi:MAG: TolC family protein [Acidobacteriota bacterium]